MALQPGFAVSVSNRFESLAREIGDKEPQQRQQRQDQDQFQNKDRACKILSREDYAAASLSEQMIYLFDEVRSVRSEQEDCGKNVRTFQAAIGFVNTKIEQVANITNAQTSLMRTLAYKSIDLEARSRRNNLIFRGFAENRDENCIRMLGDFFERRLDIDFSEIYISRAHRLGARRPGERHKSRPIIANFRDFGDVEYIMSRAYMLRNVPNLSIDYDYPKEIQEARSRLWPKLKEYRSRHPNAKVKIVYPAKLIADNRLLQDEFPEWNIYVNRNRLQNIDHVETAPRPNTERPQHSTVLQLPNVDPRGQMSQPAADPHRNPVSYSVPTNVAVQSNTPYVGTQNVASQQSVTGFINQTVFRPVVPQSMQNSSVLCANGSPGVHVNDQVPPASVTINCDQNLPQPTNISAVPNMPNLSGRQSQCVYMPCTSIAVADTDASAVRCDSNVMMGPQSGSQSTIYQTAIQSGLLVESLAPNRVAVSQQGVVVNGPDSEGHRENPLLSQRMETDNPLNLSASAENSRTKAVCSKTVVTPSVNTVCLSPSVQGNSENIPAVELSDAKRTTRTQSDIRSDVRSVSSCHSNVNKQGQQTEFARPSDPVTPSNNRQNKGVAHASRESKRSMRRSHSANPYGRSVSGSRERVSPAAKNSVSHETDTVNI